MPTAHRMLAPVALLLATGVQLSCADGEPISTTPRPRRARPSTSDLTTLLPPGAHVLVRLDLVRMRRFWAKRPWRRYFKGDPVGQRLHPSLGADLLKHADELWVALWLDSHAGVGRMLMVARGPRTEGLGLASRARRALDGRPKSRTPRPRAPPPRAKAPKWRTYRNVALAEAGGVSTALLTPFAVATGPSTVVRQTVDLLRGVVGRSSAAEDRELMALWRLVAGRGAGRAPLVAAVARLPASVRERAQKRLALPAPVHRVGLRLSGARWVTVRAFVDVAGRTRGRDTVKALHGWVQRLVSTPVGRRLRLARLLSPLSVHHEGGRVHLQWAVPARALDRHAEGLAPVLRILGGPKSGKLRPRSPRK